MSSRNNRRYRFGGVMSTGGRARTIDEMNRHPSSSNTNDAATGTVARRTSRASTNAPISVLEGVGAAAAAAAASRDCANDDTQQVVASSHALERIGTATFKSDNDAQHGDAASAAAAASGVCRTTPKEEEAAAAVAANGHDQAASSASAAKQDEIPSLSAKTTASSSTRKRTLVNNKGGAASADAKPNNRGKRTKVDDSDETTTRTTTEESTAAAVSLLEERGKAGVARTETSKKTKTSAAMASAAKKTRSKVAAALPNESLSQPEPPKATRRNREKTMAIMDDEARVQDAAVVPEQQLSEALPKEVLASHTSIDTVESSSPQAEQVPSPKATRKRNRKRTKAMDDEAAPVQEGTAVPEQRAVASSKAARQAAAPSMTRTTDKSPSAERRSRVTESDCASATISPLQEGTKETLPASISSKVTQIEEEAQVLKAAHPQCVVETMLAFKTGAAAGRSGNPSNPSVSDPKLAFQATTAAKKPAVAVQSDEELLLLPDGDNPYGSTYGNRESDSLAPTQETPKEGETNSSIDSSTLQVHSSSGGDEQGHDMTTRVQQSFVVANGATDVAEVAMESQVDISASSNAQKAAEMVCRNHESKAIGFHSLDCVLPEGRGVDRYLLPEPDGDCVKWGSSGVDGCVGDDVNVIDAPSLVPPEYLSDDVAGPRTQQSSPTSGIAPNSDEGEKVDVPSPEVLNMHDEATPPHGFYVEETAWKIHNSRATFHDMDAPEAVPGEDLVPIPSPPPIPDFPDTGKCEWSFDEMSRVLLANFVQENGNVQVTQEDEKFLLTMMERDDVTCISEGLACGIDPALWNLRRIVDACGDQFFHKFRRFDREEIEPKKAYPSSTRDNKALSLKANVDGKRDALALRTEKGEMDQDYEGSVANENLKELEETIVACKYKEMDVSVSMKIMDFGRYVSMRQSALKRMETEGPDALTSEDTDFTYTDLDENNHTIDVRTSVLYMIDFDVVKLLPRLHAALERSFGLPGCLPGGIHCMMNAINVDGRPFMGPNAYFTPPESFTQVHQDGHGTVDSGHLCLSGYNEVVMLRRLTEWHKMNAMSLLRGEGSGAEYGLYSLPHADDVVEKPDWPLGVAIDACRRMNYCPSVFILKPGQLVHINKGRLHAFRKLSPSPLPTNDCHYQQRAKLLASLDDPDPDTFLCFSIAWDWMFRGITSEGICREVLATLECAILNRINGRLSLAVPELALLQMARTLTKVTNNMAPANVPNVQFHVSETKATSGYEPPTKDILRGILPGLRYVVDQHIAAMDKAEGMVDQHIAAMEAMADKFMEDEATEDEAMEEAMENQESGAGIDKGKAMEKLARGGPRVSIAVRPNSWENPQAFALEPYGNADFFCKLCHSELSNVYMHCDGCEVLLNKDFNICVSCHSEGLFKTTVHMHPLNKARHSTINHTGNMKFDRRSRCPCKKGPVCRNCGFCAGCSCKCHQWFTLHRRFFNKDDEKSLVQRVEAAVGHRHLPFADQAAPRLEAAAASAAQGALPFVGQTSKVATAQSDSGGSTKASSTSNKKRRSRNAPASTTNAKRQRKDQSAAGALAENEEIVVARQAAKADRAARLSRRNQNDPPAAAEAAEPAKNKIRKKRETSEPVSKSPGMKTPLQLLVQDFDANQCPEDVRPSTCSPSVPGSCEDLSDGALAFSKPKGAFPLVAAGGSIEGFEAGDPASLSSFMEEARQLGTRSLSELHRLLPADSSLSKRKVRHLFRNFADAKDIRIKQRTKRNSKFFCISYSTREVAIMMYANMIGLSPDKCCKVLMPYRVGKNIYHQYADYGKWSSGMSERFKAHLEETVGVLFRMEEKGISGAESLAEIRMTSQLLPPSLSDADDTARVEPSAAKSTDAVSLQEESDRVSTQEVLSNQTGEAPSPSMRGALKETQEEVTEEPSEGADVQGFAAEAHSNVLEVSVVDSPTQGRQSASSRDDQGVEEHFNRVLSGSHDEIVQVSSDK